MKTYEVLGITQVEYTKGDRTVEGITLHLGCEQRDTDGLAVQRVYISSKSEVYHNLSLDIGDKVNIMYDINDYGKPVLCNIEVV